MLTFKVQAYFGPYLGGEFGYGLGTMNFTNMTWGFKDHGLFYGKHPSTTTHATRPARRYCC